MTRAVPEKHIINFFWPIVKINKAAYRMLYIRYVMLGKVTLFT